MRSIEAETGIFFPRTDVQMGGFQRKKHYLFPSEHSIVVQVQPFEELLDSELDSSVLKRPGILLYGCTEFIEGGWYTRTF